MGVIYKLKPEIQDYILQKRAAEPNLGCRKLAALVLEEFQVEISKSSINFIIQEKGLSMPVGRRRKHRRGIEQAPELGLAILKAADYLAGGNLSLLNSQIPQLSPGAFQEVSSLKLTCADGASFYLDAQLRTVWPLPHLPRCFFTTPYNIKSYINKYFQQDLPFLLFMAAGYTAPTKEFFGFISSLDQGQKITQITLFNPKGEELETIPIEQEKRRGFIFGLWPWQFPECRQVKRRGEFRPYYFWPLKEDFLVADSEVELVQPSENKRVTLKGCTLKRSAQDKIELLILSNLTLQNSPEELAQRYLSHWPNLEEGFGDYSRKIEFSLSPTENPSPQDYLRVLDLYARQCFFPRGYETKDFSTMQAQFYGLPGQIKKQKGQLLLTFKPPQDHPCLKDLVYVCRRLNEKEIVLSDGQRLWFETAF